MDCQWHTGLRLHRMFLRFRAIEEDLAFLDQEVDTIGKVE